MLKPQVKKAKVRQSSKSAIDFDIEQAFFDLSDRQRASIIASDSVLSGIVDGDLKRGLRALNISEDLSVGVISALRDPRNGIEKAREILGPYRDSHFYPHFQNRSARLAATLKEPLIEASLAVQGNRQLFDWGTGDKQVASEIKRLLPYFEVSGGDIIEYYREVDPPVAFHAIENNRVPAIKDNSVAVVTLNYVLHHEKKSQAILNEVARMLVKGGRAIVVELVPQGAGPKQQYLDRLRLLFSDLVFCVVWHRDDKIPMPGNYRQVRKKDGKKSWEAQFQGAGLRLIDQKIISGTPVIYAGNDGRQLLVCEKI